MKCSPCAVLLAAGTGGGAIAVELFSVIKKNAPGMLRTCLEATRIRSMLSAIYYTG